HAPGARCVIVRGLYGHVSFILDPAPVRIRVLEVVPPWPPKLVDQLRRVLDIAEDLPPVELVPELVDLRDLAARRPAERYLFPCRAGQGAPDGALPAPGGTTPPSPPVAKVSYLDEIPAREPWTLVGCARSRSIHDWFYGDEVPQVDMCPRNLGGPAWRRSPKACAWRWRPGPSEARCDDRPDRGLRPLPAPVGDGRGQGGARRRGPAGRLARSDHGAGPGPGRGRADPGPGGRTDRGARSRRPDRPGLRGRADPAGLAFHAGPDPGPAGRAARAGPRLRLRRGHRAGHHRHLDGAGAAPDRRP